ncbi:MAG: hypothetical protein Kow00123_23720 [Anaerolineales bacterium]
MPSRSMTRKEEKEKKKTARAAFLLYLKRLRAACKLLNTADEWYSLMRDLADLLQEYAPVIPPDPYERIQSAMRPADTTRKGLKQACKVLDMEIERLLKHFPAGRAGGKILAGAFIAAAVIVGAAVIYGEATAVDITIVNEGCSTIILPGSLPFPIPGVSLPSAPIPSGGSGSVSLPRLTVEVDATQPGQVSVSVLGVAVPYNLGGDVVSIRLDGQEILGERVRANLGDRKSHELVVRCR